MRNCELSKLVLDFYWLCSNEVAVIRDESSSNGSLEHINVCKEVRLQDELSKRKVFLGKTELSLLLIQYITDS